MKRQDPLHKSKIQVLSSAQTYYEFVKTTKASYSKEYLNFWIEKNETVKSQIIPILEDTLNECSLPYHLFKNKRNAICFVGSSMPIRDLERFSMRSGKNDFIFNRGASGIDGNIATAVGAALASDQDLICLVGDLTALHDLNSMTLFQSQLKSKKVKLIVINNSGGGIFSFLPISQIDTQSEPGTFHKYFTTPHNFQFEPIAKAFLLNYQSPRNPRELEDAISHPHSSLIEVVTQIDDNVKFHRDITSHIKSLFVNE
jgi:2-succinyl-5-enolpyruvyl-6-hydroxy-3-cyclohexene-1-carboxylate synthase